MTMAFWRERAGQDEQLARYLLGLLPEDEAERLDELSVVDDEVADRLRVAEDDLVDAYVAGTLDGARLERFESFYLASPLRRERVQFAERFLRAVDRQPLPSAPRGGTPPAARLRRAWLPLVAALLLAACGILIVEDMRLQRGLGEARREGAALDQQARRLAAELGAQRAEVHARSLDADRARAPRRSPSIALVLLPQTRAAGPVSAIAVPAGADVVPFDLRLEGADYARYEAVLRDPATNRIVWRSAIISSRSSPRTGVVSVVVPARLLKPQHYSFELSGGRAAGPLDIIGSYAFQVEPK